MPKKYLLVVFIVAVSTLFAPLPVRTSAAQSRGTLAYGTWYWFQWSWFDFSNPNYPYWPTIVNGPADLSWWKANMYSDAVGPDISTYGLPIPSTLVVDDPQGVWLTVQDMGSGTDGFAVYVDNVFIGYSSWSFYQGPRVFTYNPADGVANLELSRGQFLIPSGQHTIVVYVPTSQAGKGGGWLRVDSVAPPKGTKK